MPGSCPALLLALRIGSSMAKIGTLSMDAGVDGCERPTAAAFSLKTNPAFEFSGHPSGSDWEVELQRNEDTVVAHWKTAPNLTDALHSGRESVEEALDRLCFRFNDPLELKSPGDVHLVLTPNGGNAKLTYHTAAPFDVRVGPIEVTVTDKSGTTRAQSTTPVTWMPVLRYYRLSQTREDIFDAYRYVFLAFEALLQGLYPIQRQQGGEGARMDASRFGWGRELGGQSGVMTNVWFQNAIKEDMADGLGFVCSEDPSPFDPALNKFGPRDFPSYYFHEIDVDCRTAFRKSLYHRISKSERPTDPRNPSRRPPEG
jgi:hypothetical protein